MKCPNIFFIDQEGHFRSVLTLIQEPTFAKKVRGRQNYKTQAKRETEFAMLLPNYAQMLYKKQF